MTVAEYQQAQNDIAEIKAQIAQLRDVVAKGVPAVREIYGADLPTPEPLPEAGASYPNVGALQFQQGKMMAGVEAAKKAVMPTTEALGAIRGNPEDQGETRRDIAKKLVEILTMGAGEAPDSTANAIANLGSGTAALIATAPAMLPLTVEQSVAGGVERGNPLAPATDMAQAIGQTFQRQVTGEAGGVTRGEAWSKTPVEEGFNLAAPLLAGLGIAKTRTPKIKSIKEARAAINDIGKPKVDVPEVVQESIRSETPVEQPASAAEVVGKAKDAPIAVDEMNINKQPLEPVGVTDNLPSKPTAELNKATDYRSAHQIDPSNSRNVGDLLSIDDDIAQIRGKYGLTNYDRKDIANLKKILGNPDADVVVYRASPVNELNSGDWVTTDRIYANDIKRQNGGKVYKHNVKVKDLNLPANLEDNPSSSRFSAFQYVRKADDIPTTKQPTTATEVVAKANTSTLRDALGKMLVKDAIATKDAEIGTNILLDMSERGFSPQKVHEEFINNVYDRLPEDIRAKFNKLIEKQTGEKVGQYWKDHKTMAKELIDLGDDAEMLEGTERGFAVMEAEAVKRFSGEGVPLIGEKPNAVTQGVKQLTPDELTAAQAKLREKFKPMDEAIDNGAGKISTEQPTATVQDAAVRPAQSTTKAKEPWEMRPREWIKGVKDGDNEWSAMVDKHFSAIDEFNRDIDTPGTYAEKTMRGSHLAADPFQRKHPEHAYASVRSGLASDALIPRLSSHKAMVEQALKDGKPVPPEVLADYPDLAAKYGKPTTAEAVVKKAGGGVERGLKAWADNEMYVDGQGNYRWGKNSAEQRGRIVPFNKELKGRFKDSSELHNAAKAYKDSPTELHAGVNPFKIIDDYMTKRKLVNPLGTPEHVLSGKGIVEPFRKAQESIRNETKARGESLQETLKGIQRGSHEDNTLYHRLDDPTAVLNEQEQAVRNYLDDLLTEVNKHREARGQEPVKRRKGYITHLVEEVEKQSREYGDTPMPKRFKFQFELAREGNASHKVSAIEALEVYTKAALKDIYIGDALAETVPKIEAMGDRPLIFKKSVTSEDGKVTNQSFYQFSDAPIITERGYAEAFIKGQMNVPTVGQRALETAFDIKPNTSQQAAMAITARFYQSLLGLAVDSGVKNLTQGINTLAELGVTPTLGGYAKMATPKGLKLARAEHLLEDFNPLLMEGADLPFKTKTARAIGKGFSATLNAPMKVAEFINRGAAFHAAYDVFIKKGMSLEQAHEAARAAVRKTQFSYSKIDTSPALRGPFARTFSQFFSYPLKQSEMMYKWATKPGEQGKLIRYFLYTGMAVVGAKYAGVDMSGVFFDPIKMVDPNSKEGFQLPGSDKRVTIDPKKLGKSGYTPQGFAPSISIPYDFVKSQMSDDESTRAYGRTKALTSITPGGRYGKKVYDVITESDEKGKRDRLTRENTDKDKTLKLLGFRGTEREAESSRRESVVEVEKKYYATRQKLIDLKISGNEDEFIKVRDEFRDKYPFLYGRLMKGFGDAVKEERKKKGMTTDERFFDNSLRKQIDANL